MLRGKLSGLDYVPALVRQIPIAAFFFAAAILSLSHPAVTVISRPALLGCLALVVAATGLAAVSDRPALLRFAVIVPVLDTIAAMVLRYAAGEDGSIFEALPLLPVLWLAMMQGRRYILFSSLGILLPLLFPLAVNGSIMTNPVGVLRAFYSTAVFLLVAAVVNELACTARRRLELSRERAAAAAEELQRAAEVQRFLLPTTSEPVPGYETAGACIPAKAVGGDFFDWYTIDGGLGFTLGDVMGKGAGAGMIAATTRAVIRSARKDEDPVKALTRVSDSFTSTLSEASSFATLFHARLRAEDGRVLFTDAGHGLTLLIRTDASWERLASRELPVGLVPEAIWHSFEVYLKPGDMIVSFSDGVLDLYDGTLAAVEEIALLAAAAVSAQDIVDAVHERALKAANPDDVTILAVRRTGQQNPARTAANERTTPAAAAR